MPQASDAQVQAFVNERVRPRCEQIRSLYLQCKSDKAVIDDIYANLTQDPPTWSDSRADAPPHLLTPQDVLSWNAFITGFIALMEQGSAQEMTDAQPQVPHVLAACLRAP